jgi:hypothetical protein
MRLTFLASAIFTIALTSMAVAQDWITYVSREDFFSVNFPAAPTIEKFTYVTEYNSKVPATRYTARHGAQVFTMTVVNLTTTDRDANRQGIEIRGTIQWASGAFRRAGTVTADTYSELEGVPGQMLQVTLPNGSRNFAAIHLHKRRLYIAEAVAPAGSPPPLFYLTSMGFLDAEGRPLTYVDNDSYTFPDGRPAPTRGEPVVATGAN